MAFIRPFSSGGKVSRWGEPVSHLPASCGFRWSGLAGLEPATQCNDGRQPARRWIRQNASRPDETTRRRDWQGDPATRPWLPDRMLRSLFLSRGGRDFFPGHSPPDWTVASGDSLAVPHWTGPRKAGRLQPFWMESRSEAMSLLIGRRARPCPRGQSRLCVVVVHVVVFLVFFWVKFFKITLLTCTNGNFFYINNYG